ncbi:hypothetical protein DPQ33_06265 [Oceanidesulfovibrio indonesiensis]|uniref:HD domain-containing protein n=1 Tax=Oceanidesulfovibrio indonesiensis TaxID=54767 RepID=A0A7M3MGB3_9BACT|nr:HD domain-containing protein [Oceanidesulfovibrio indonesiensis]TVM18354.1 hypothetical protein DPQ33_06265 [Oceanidesulfovibrio indonesiensis]
MRLYLAGGAVRDMLLGRAASDRDFVYFGEEAELLERFPRAKRAGKSFAIFIYHGMEFAPPRGATIHEDLLRRDLTVNALAMAEDGRLFVHPKAVEDLQNRVLRPASEDSFREDPLRVFRAPRFLAEHPDFTPHPELVQSMREATAEKLLDDLDPERVGAEVLKTLASPEPGNFLRCLAEGRCLEPWFAELAGAEEIPAGPLPFHDESVLEHTARAMDRAARMAQAFPQADAQIAVWMTMCHDLGKTTTDPAVWPRHYGHESRGERAADALAARLRLSNRLRKAGAMAARHHMNIGRYDELRPGTRVDILDALHRVNLVEEMLLCAAADGGMEPDNEMFRNLRDDLSQMLEVSLLPEDRGLGPESGEKLRMLRAQALARRGSQFRS